VYIRCCSKLPDIVKQFAPHQNALQAMPTIMEQRYYARGLGTGFGAPSTPVPRVHTYSLA
jgi:hypothetical protein